MSAQPKAEPWERTEATWRKVVSHVRAGRTLKPRAWKGGARCAVAISFDPDHESLELKVGGKSFSKISQGQYGARAGMPRIMTLLDRMSVPASFYMPAVIATLYPDQVRAIVDNGHELGIHGWIHERNADLGYETERDLTFRARDTLERLAGRAPVGMRTPSWDFSPSTLRIIREMGLLYDSSLMADDEPYELLEHGEPTGVVELPVEWIRDDAIYFNMDRFAGLRPHMHPEGVFDIFRREFEVSYDEGGLFLLTLHPHHIGHRSRMWILEELIRLAKSRPDVWFATHAEIAAYCAAEAGLAAPAPRSLQPAAR